MKTVASGSDGAAVVDRFGVRAGNGRAQDADAAVAHRPGRDRPVVHRSQQGQQRLGGSALAQVYGQLGDDCPDVDDPRVLKLFFHIIQALNELGLAYAYHDRSDGGLFTTLCEWPFPAAPALKWT